MEFFFANILATTHDTRKRQMNKAYTQAGKTLNNGYTFGSVEIAFSLYFVC